MYLNVEPPELKMRSPLAFWNNFFSNSNAPSRVAGFKRDVGSMKDSHLKYAL